MVHKIHVLFFCNFLNGGGAEMHFARLIKSLDGNKFRKTLVVAKSGGDYEYLLEGTDVEIKSLGVDVRSSLLRMVMSVWPLARIIREQNPDITFSIMDFANVFAQLAHRISAHHSKMIVGVQTSTKKAVEFSGSLMNKIVFYQMRRSYKNASRIICLSTGVSKELQRLLPNTRESQYKVVHNIGIEPKGELQVTNKHDYQICICGRLIQLKGFDLVIRAVSELKATFPDVKLVVLGEGPEKGKLQKLVEDLELFENVDFKGFVKNVTEVMSKSQVFVLSSYYEGFGNVIVEAMASGTPVIATNCPYGPDDIITNGVDGLLTEVGSSQGIAASIAKLFSDRKLYAKIRYNGFIRSQDFTPSVIAREHEELFLELVNS